MSYPDVFLLRATVLLLISIVAIENCAAIQCYVCNSQDDSRCLATELLEDDMKETCPKLEPSNNETYKLCRKIHQRIDPKNGKPEDLRVIRSCGWNNSSYTNECYYRRRMTIRQTICACDSDFCNHTPRLIPIVWSTFVIFLVPLVLIRS